MRAMLIGATALLLLSTVGYAAEKKTPADVMKILSQIEDDKEKLKIFCEAEKLDSEAVAAAVDDEQDKAKGLHQKAIELRIKLGVSPQMTEEAFGGIIPDSVEMKKFEAEVNRLKSVCQ
jgi:hypothetical protein